MNRIVLDLEWNQSSSGKEPEIAMMPFEIIEIGAIKLNDACEMVGEFNELIRPRVYRKLYHITSKLVHLQMKELERGRDFETVSSEFRLWCGEEYQICTWGPADVAELQRNLRFFKQPLLVDGPVPYLDVQKLFALAFEEDKKTRRNLEYAVDYLRIDKDIPFHRAFSDAYYTAKVYAAIEKQFPHLLKFVSYDVTLPPKSKEEELHLNFIAYEKYISRAFPSKEAALADKEVLSSRCYLCGKNLKKQVKWFSVNGRHYFSVAYCDKHGFMKGKIRVQKLDEERVCIVKTNKIISDAEVNRIIDKRAKAVEMRHKRKAAEKAERAAEKEKQEQP